MEAKHPPAGLCTGFSGCEAMKNRVRGSTVIRFWNDEIMKSIDDVCLRILMTADKAEPRKAQQKRQSLLVKGKR